MKKRITLLILVLLLTLAVAAPAFADPGGPCANVPPNGWFLMRGGRKQFQVTGEFHGRFYGGTMGQGLVHACK